MEDGDQEQRTTPPRPPPGLGLATFEQHPPISPIAHHSHHHHRQPSNNGLVHVQSLRHPVLRSDHVQHDLLSQQLVSPIMSRSPSVASDRFSTISALTSTYFPPNPKEVNPPPAYVAPFGAAQVVNEHRALTHHRHPSDDEEEDDDDTRSDKNDLQFSNAALALVNAFLDQLLFSFLATAKSTALSALKPSVTDVLKSRLARDAIASAEEELHELLAGGDDDDDDDEESSNTKHNSSESGKRWDLELVWKRTRLRVMVYMRLGEMEDEDEERYIKEEELFQGNERRFSQTSGLVSWAAAIFLTGVLEYVAEQSLQIAGNAAFARAKRQARGVSTAVKSGDRAPVTVEEHDVEKIALSPTLGRLWRTWRKLLRTAANHPSISRLNGESLERPSSSGTDVGRGIGLEDVPEMDYPEHVLASNIPLPIGDPQRDVDEIEVPGLAGDPDQVQQDNDPVSVVRRNSVTGVAGLRRKGDLLTPHSTGPVELEASARPLLARKRSNSVPTPARNTLFFADVNHMPGAFPEEVETAPLENSTVANPKVVPDEGHVVDESEAAPQNTTVAECPEEDREVPAASEASPPDVLDEESAFLEQKANAAEMAPLKRPVEDSSRNSSTGDLAGLPSQRKADRKRHGLLGSALTGSAAAAAAAAAGASLASRQQQYEESQADASVEADKRKSLLDMKSLLLDQPNGQAETVHSENADALSTGLEVQRPQSSSQESEKSYTLGDRSSQPVQAVVATKSERSLQPQTTDDRDNVGGSLSNGVVPSPLARLVEAQGSNVQTKPTRLILGSSSRDDSSAATENAPSNSSAAQSAQEFLESRSLPSKTDSPESTVHISQDVNDQQQAGAPKQAQKRRSISGAAFTNATAQSLSERKASRESWVAAVQSPRDVVDEEGQRQLTASPVEESPTRHFPRPQEHRIQQRVIKPSRLNTDKGDAVDGERALTSASIRGPQDFDQYLQSSETMKYTLTPEAVRDGPAKSGTQQLGPASPVELSSVPSFSRRKQHAESNHDANDSRMGRSQKSKQATSADEEGEDEDDDEETRLRKKANRRSISRPPPRNLSAHRRSGLMAREPRIMTESTQDFADFIRSTGPSKEQDVQPILSPTNRSTVSLHSLRSAHINGALRSSSTPSLDRSRGTNKAAADAEHVPPVPPMPNQTKRALEPRAPQATGRNAELIDFIRSGPSQEPPRRADADVVPVRSTMNPDKPRDVAPAINQSVKSSSRPTTGSSSHSRPASSRTAQGPSNAAQTVHPAHSGQPQRLSAVNGNAPVPVNESVPAALPSIPGGIPKKRRHRNKDPYAIDFDDDDNDLLTALPMNKRQEESLIDFLNSTEPPEDNAPRSLAPNGIDNRTLATKPRSNSVKSQRSSHSLKAKSAQQQSGPRPPPPPPKSSGPTTVPPPGASYVRPTTGAPRPRMEARGPATIENGRNGQPKDSSTRELADFLKNSGPPEGQTAPSPIVGRQSKLSPKQAAKAQKKVEADSKGKRGFFARTIKRTWLDMP